jgi:hypothetical protein
VLLVKGTIYSRFRCRFEASLLTITAAPVPSPAVSSLDTPRPLTPPAARSVRRRETWLARGPDQAWVASIERQPADPEGCEGFEIR